MSRLTRPSATVVLSAVLLLASVARVASAQQAVAQPSPPDWRSFAGWQVFSQAGCGGCHALRGVGGGVGPDLGRTAAATSFFDLGAAAWNHLPRMGARMAQARVERPRLSPEDMGNLLAFIFTAQYYDDLGDPNVGESLFATKGCARCHEVGGQGGRVGPGLDFLKRANSPVLVAAAMWNHGPEMAAQMKASGIPRPTFQGREMQDLIAYITSAARGDVGPTMQVLPGTPSRGQRLFDDKRCSTCHRVGARGGTVGPSLGGRGEHISLTALAGRMWNHGPRMWAEMQARRIEVPRLSGQDMADLLAYLYVAHYVGPTGNAGRGRKLAQAKGCLTCHAVAGKGAKIGPDFATSPAGASPAAVVAGMWNHSFSMETVAQRQGIAWPELTGQDLADLVAYLRSVAKGGGKPR